MKRRELWVALFALVHSSSPVAAEKSLDQLRSELRSMEACRSSLDHEDCNLEILEPSTRQNLERIHALQQQKSLLMQGGGLNQLSVPDQELLFFTDQVWGEDDGIVSLLGGSKWRVGAYTLLGGQDVIAVLSGPRTATFYADRMVYAGTLIDGAIIPSRGVLTSVNEVEGEGALLFLSNGMLLSIDSYDRFDTGFWLPPYRVIVDQQSMKMWNLDEGKSVWIQRIRQP